MTTLLKRIFLLLLLALNYNSSLGQAATGNTSELTITDPPLYNTLTNYIALTRALVVAIFIERVNNEYTYLFYNPAYYEFVENNPPTYWGRLKGRTILFYAGTEDIIQMQDSTMFKILLKQVRPLLDNQFTPPSMSTNAKKHSNGNKTVPDLVETGPVPTGYGTAWRLKTKAGKQVSLETNEDPVTATYARINIPYIKYRKRKSTSH